jgi:predicted XRE-type DNA-binding protein
MTRITRGTTNVFDDLGFSDAVELQTKTRLALAVNELLKAQKLKQGEIATVLAVTQPEASALKNYRLDQFSFERLMQHVQAIEVQIASIHDVDRSGFPLQDVEHMDIAHFAVQIDAILDRSESAVSHGF